METHLLAPYDLEKLEQSHRGNRSPEAVTRMLRKAVPLLEHLGFAVEEMGTTLSICSLQGASLGSNQNGTLQASTFYLLADYAVGVAMAAAFPGIPFLGIEESCEAPAIRAWLKNGVVKHIRPATGNLRAEVSIPQEEQTRLRKELSELGKSVYTGQAQIFQGETLVALAEHTMMFMIFNEP